MCRHIIGSFVIMQIFRIIFWNSFIKEHFKIRPYRRIGILINGKGRGGVLDKDLAHPHANFVQLRQRLYKLSCYEVVSTTPTSNL